VRPVVKAFSFHPSDTVNLQTMSLLPLLLGHRGARARKAIPENTPGSFDRALADGCDGFEFDVRLTADSEAVICHDPRIGRLKISATPTKSLAELPTLRQILQRYRSSAFLDIELKVAGLESILMAALRKYPPRREFVVSSFLPGVLLAVHAAAPQIPLGLICETRTQLARWRKLPVEYVIPYHRLVTRKLLNEMKSEGRNVLVWTVNNAATMRRFASWGVDGIISDNPDRLVTTLRGPN
jgi:glycerophosphoryl diester phosphodiesterase